MYTLEYFAQINLNQNLSLVLTFAFLAKEVLEDFQSSNKKLGEEEKNMEPLTQKTTNLDDKRLQLRTQ